MKKENTFQKDLIYEIKRRFPGAFVLKNDSSYIQGVPDLLILYKNHWAMLEVKRNSTAIHQPNQEYYVKRMDDMSFSRFIYPENKEIVLNEMEEKFKGKKSG